MSEEQREDLKFDDEKVAEELLRELSLAKSDLARANSANKKPDLDFTQLDKKPRDFLSVLVSVLSIVTICVCTVTLIMMINLKNDMLAVRQDLKDIQLQSESGIYAAVSNDNPISGTADDDLSDVENVHGEMVDASEAADIVEVAELENVIWNEDTDSSAGIRRVYLTFDDGPSSNTDTILDILDQYGVKSTFFVVGKDNYNDQYKRIVEDGHTLAMHSYSHVYRDIYQSVDAYSQDLSKLHNYLYELTGVDCNIVRFPGGSSNTVSRIDMKELVEYLDEQGMVYFDWNVSSGDAVHGYISPQQIADNVLNYVDKYNNAVVLLHDAGDKDTTVDALPLIIEKILESENTVLLPITEETVPVHHLH